MSTLIHIKTNLDHYKPVNWPVLSFVPRVGEYVEVAPSSFSYCDSKEIPRRLIVHTVTYTLKTVNIEVYYDRNALLYKDKKTLFGQ